MKKCVLTLSGMSLCLLLLTACNNSSNSNATESSQDTAASQVLTAEKQATLTPSIVLQMLKDGNKDYTEGNLTVRNNPQRISEAADGQYPKAVIVSCLDSRVPVEDIFHQGIGDLFVARVAGNFVNEDILGSLEYACKVSGSKLIVVLGHENCGAVNSAIKDVKLGNITAMLSKIRPSVEAITETNENPSIDNADFVQAVCTQNVKHAINEIRAKSEILREMEANGEIEIVGGMYHLDTGVVDFF